jgi:hypothetical protein
MSAPGAGQGVSWVDVAASAAGIYSQMQAIGAQAAEGLSRGMSARLPGALIPVIQGSIAGAVEGAIGSTVGASLERQLGAEITGALGRVGPTLRAAWQREMAGVREAFSTTEGAAAAEQAGAAIAGGFARGVGGIRQTIQTLFGGGLQTAAVETQAVEAGQRIGRAVTGGLKQTLAGMAGTGGWLDTKQFEIAAAEMQARMMQLKGEMAAAQAETAAAGKAEWAAMAAANTAAARKAAAAEIAEAQAFSGSVQALNRVQVEATLRGLQQMAAAQAAYYAKTAAMSADRDFVQKWRAGTLAASDYAAVLERVGGLEKAAAAAQAERLVESAAAQRMATAKAAVIQQFSEAGAAAAQSMGSSFDRALYPLAAKFVPKSMLPALKEFFGQAGAESAAAFDKNGWPVMAESAAAGGAKVAGSMSMAMKAGLAGLAVLGVDMAASLVKNMVSTINTEATAFLKVGKDLGDTLMGAFKSVIEGQMPDVGQAIGVGLEGIQTAMQMPLNLMNAGLEATVGKIPILGGMITSVVGEASGVLGTFFSVLQTYTGIAGQFGEALLDIGNKWQDVARTIAGQTIDLGNLNKYVDVVRDIATSGDLVHFRDVAQIVGELNQRLSGLNEGAGLSRQQLINLSTAVAEANELLGDIHINVDLFTGALNDFNVKAEDTTKELTFVANLARETGADFNTMSEDVDQVAPAMLALGYSMDQVYFILAKMNEEMGKPAMTRWAFGIAQVMTHFEKLGYDQAHVNQAMEDFVQTVRGYVAANNEMAAVDFAKQIVQSSRTANIIVDAIRKNVFASAADIQKLIDKEGEALTQPLDQALNATKSLQQSMEQLSNSVLAALAPLGTALVNELGGAGQSITEWLQTHQAEFVEWVGRIGEWLLQAGAKLMHGLAGLLHTFAPFVESAKNMMVSFGEDMVLMLDHFSFLMPGLHQAIAGLVTSMERIRNVHLDTAMNALGEGADWAAGQIQGLEAPLARITGNAADAAKAVQAFSATFKAIDLKTGVEDEAAKFQLALQGSVEDGLKIAPEVHDKIINQIKGIGVSVTENEKGVITGFVAHSQEGLDAVNDMLNSALGPEEFAKLGGTVKFSLDMTPEQAKAQFLKDHLGVPSEFINAAGDLSVTGEGGLFGANPPPWVTDLTNALKDFTHGGDKPTKPPSQDPGNAAFWIGDIGAGISDAIGTWINQLLGGGRDPIGSWFSGEQYQYGGTVTGPGGTDQVLIRATAGEKVMNLGASSRFGEVLDWMNLQAFANGGTVMDAAGVPANLQAGAFGGAGSIALPAGINVITPQPMTVSDTLISAGIPDKLQGDIQQAGVTETGVSLPTALTTKEQSRRDAAEVMTAAGIPDRLQDGDGVKIDVKLNLAQGDTTLSATSLAAAAPGPGGPVQDQALQALLGGGFAGMLAGGFPQSEFAPLSNIIQGESSWDPGSYNDWDINAQQGNPSVGLGQLTLSNYRAYGFPQVTSVAAAKALTPYQQVTAMLNYMKGRYHGGPQHVWDVQWAANRNYATGGHVGLREDAPVPRMGSAGYKFLGFALGGMPSGDLIGPGYDWPWHGEEPRIHPGPPPVIEPDWIIPHYVGGGFAFQPGGDVGDERGDDPGAPGTSRRRLPWPPPFDPNLPTGGSNFDPRMRIDTSLASVGSQRRLGPVREFLNWGIDILNTGRSAGMPPEVQLGVGLTNIPILRGLRIPGFQHGGATSSLSYHSESHLAPHVGLPVSKTSVWSHMLTGGVPISPAGGGLWTSPNPAWAHLIMRESSGRPNITQSAGVVDVNTGWNEAEGLFQITPETWAAHGGEKFGTKHPGMATPEQQAEVAADIFRAHPDGRDWLGIPPDPKRENADELAAGLGMALHEKGFAAGGLAGFVPGGLASGEYAADDIQGVDAEILGADVIAHQMGLRLTSGKARHSIDSGYHPKGMAGDFGNGVDTPEETRFATYMASNYGPHIAQLIHAGGGWNTDFNIGDGKFIRDWKAQGNSYYDAKTLGEHHDHVHLAMVPGSAPDLEQLATSGTLPANWNPSSGGLTFNSGSGVSLVSAVSSAGGAGAGTAKAAGPLAPLFAGLVQGVFEALGFKLPHPEEFWDWVYGKTTSASPAAAASSPAASPPAGPPAASPPATAAITKDTVGVPIDWWASPASERKAPAPVGGYERMTHVDDAGGWVDAAGHVYSDKEGKKFTGKIWHGADKPMTWAPGWGPAPATTTPSDTTHPVAMVESGGLLPMAGGGHIKGYHLPGRDTVPMMVPAGTFILNRHRSMQYRDIADNILGMAAGGMIPIITEPGERVFPPGSAPPGFLHAMNQGRLLRREPGGGTDDDTTTYTAPDGSKVILVDRTSKVPEAPGGAPQPPPGWEKFVVPPGSVGPHGVPAVTVPGVGTFNFSFELSPEQQSLITPTEREKMDQYINDQRKAIQRTTDATNTASDAQEKLNADAATRDALHQAYDKAVSDFVDSQRRLGTSEDEITRMINQYLLDETKGLGKKHKEWMDAEDKVKADTIALGKATEHVSDDLIQQRLTQEKTYGKGAATTPDENAAAMGAGLIKGMAQELGFGDVFGKPPWQWGIWKLFAGGASAALGIANQLGEAGGARTGAPALGGQVPSSPAAAGLTSPPAAGGAVPGSKPGQTDPAKMSTKPEWYGAGMPDPATGLYKNVPLDPEAAKDWRPEVDPTSGKVIGWVPKGEQLPSEKLSGRQAGETPYEKQQREAQAATAAGAGPMPPGATGWVPPFEGGPGGTPPPHPGYWAGEGGKQIGPSYKVDPNDPRRLIPVDQPAGPAAPAVPPSAPGNVVIPWPADMPRLPGVHLEREPGGGIRQYPDPTPPGPPPPPPPGPVRIPWPADMPPVPGHHLEQDPGGGIRQVPDVAFVQPAPGGGPIQTGATLVSAVQSLGDQGDGSGTPQLASYKAGPMDWLMHPARTALMQQYQRTGTLPGMGQASDVASWMQASQGPANLGTAALAQRAGHLGGNIGTQINLNVNDKPDHVFQGHVVSAVVAGNRAPMASRGAPQLV